MADADSDNASMDWEGNPSTLDAHLSEMPTEEWWHEAHQSFQMLQQLVRPEWMAKRFQEQYDPNQPHSSNENTINQRLAQETYLPFINALPSGNYRLGLSATNEPLECIAFGTMGAQRFLEVFWEAVVLAQQLEDTVVVHEVQSAEPRIWLTVGLHDFLLTYVQCEKLVRSFPSVIKAPSFFLDGLHNCTRDVRNMVTDLKATKEVTGNLRKAYHYVRAWGIAMGLFKTKFNAQDFLDVCPPKPECPNFYIADEENGTYYDSRKDSSDDTPEEFRLKDCAEVGDMIARFLSHIGFSKATPPDTSVEAIWEKILLVTESQPFFAKMRKFPYFIEVSLVYSGTSMVQGFEWLSMVDREVVQLKERLEARLSTSEIQIWPQRLFDPKTDPNDEIYEAFVMIGLKCSEADRSLANDVAASWQRQVLEETMFKSECFMHVTFYDRASTVASKRNLKPSQKTWPKPIIKPGQEHLNWENFFEAQVGRVPNPRTLRLGLPPNMPPQKPPFTTQVSKPPQTTNQINNIKAPPLRPASDVLSRLRHDRALNIDDYVVCYRDRHDPAGQLKEKPAREWERESSHEEWIPEGRIERFRRGGEVVWDRGAGVDRVFGSGRGAGEGNGGEDVGMGTGMDSCRGLR